MLNAVALATLARRAPYGIAVQAPVACGEAGKDYAVTYNEQRRNTEAGSTAAPEPVTEVAAGASLPFDWTAIPPTGQTVTGYRWSSRQGPPAKLQSGTLASGSVADSSGLPF